jgi:hypothetical protein
MSAAKRSTLTTTGTWTWSISPGSKGSWGRDSAEQVRQEAKGNRAIGDLRFERDGQCQPSIADAAVAHILLTQKWHIDES